jgi:hypothetical protein
VAEDLHRGGVDDRRPRALLLVRTEALVAVVAFCDRRDITR